MENLSEEQKQQMLKRRQEMFKKMGAPKAGQVLQETVVNTGSAASSMAAKIAALKNGGARNKVAEVISSLEKGGSAAGQLPEPKMKKGPHGPNHKEEVKPEYKQKLEDFGGPAGTSSQELSSIEAMFGGGDSYSTRGPSTQNQAHHPINSELSLDSSIGLPAFNPNAFQQKMKAKAAQVQQTQGGNSPYLQYAGENPQANEYFETEQPQVNLNQLQMMMEKIAKGVAEKTIKNVLSEYSEQQKSKLYFEYYNREKNVIKMPDGKLYQLTPVQIKKKTS